MKFFLLKNNLFFIPMIILIITIYPRISFTQGCLLDGISFTSQSQINSFHSDYPYCSYIVGPVTINDFVFGNITNLDSLIYIDSIGGGLFINSNGLLTNLSGLDSLKYISGNLSVSNNNSLLNINALIRLKSIDGGLSLVNNNGLSSLAGLDSISIISGYLNIDNNNSLIDLTGLNKLNNLAGGFNIENNSSLISLQGLNNLNSFSGSISVTNNASLMNISALGLISSSNYLFISNNASLPNLQGLNSITAILGDVYINSNSSLTSLLGLGSVQYINGNLTISSNYLLNDISDLINVTFIDGYLKLNSNYTLPSLYGIDNINGASITSLTLTSNSNLSLCNAASICNYLSLPYNSAIISGNASGCENRPQVEIACYGTGCPPGDLIFNTQSEIDDFQINYPQCTSITGNVSISESYPGNIIDLSGLSLISNITGYLIIYGNNSLANLTGLNSLTNVGGELNISYNASLTDLSALSSLNSISGELLINNNSSLSSLSGLDNITPSSIAYLQMQGSPNLTTCDVQSICDYISIPVNPADIYNNAPGCLDRQEVQSHCTGCPLGDVVLSTQQQIDDFIIIHPSCNQIDGNLTINDNGSGNITNLNGLSQLSTISGTLYLSDNSALTNLNGLDNITNINGYLYIHNNANLSNIEGFNSLYSIGQALVIDNNPSLTSLLGLGTLTTIGTFLSIYNNNSLSNLTSLNSLSSINGSLEIASNPSLTNLSGLNNIDPSSISSLTIQSSNNLSLCNIPNICEYLNNPLNSALISGNSFGCENREQVQNLCGGCVIGNINLSSQMDIDNFPLTYPGCTEVFGELKIEEITPGDILNLDGLEQLTSISGNLKILNNNSLINLNGLHNLNHIGSIGSTIQVFNNDALINLSGFSSLNQIDGYLNIQNNDVLINLTGLNSVTYIKSLQLYGNASLSDLTALNNLQYLGFLSIGFNNSLSSLNGLNNIITIDGNFNIYNNSLLGTLNGLNSLHSINGNFFLSGNTALSNIQDLSNLNSINGTITISDNDQLNSLSGIDNIDHTSFTNLVIQNSNTLAICDVPSICNYLQIPSNPASISGNAVGCINRAQVEAYCTDQDYDGIIDSLDNCKTIYNPMQEDSDNDGIGNACDFGSENNVGIGTETPTAKLQVAQGVVFTDNNNGSLLMRSPDNSCWILKVDNFGALTAKKVPCPE